MTSQTRTKLYKVGAYDIIAKINTESTESLSRIIGLDIKKLDRIQSTLTLIVNEDL
jgi:DNA-binding Lrp family transcriptional regulator